HLCRHLLSFPTRRSSDLSPSSSLWFIRQINILQFTQRFCRIQLLLQFNGHIPLLPDGIFYKFFSVDKFPNRLSFISYLLNLYFIDRKSTRLNSSHVSISY